MTKHLDRGHDLLLFVAIFQAEHGYGPSVREMMTGIGLVSPSAAWFWIEILLERGWLKHTPNIARSTVLTDAGTAVLKS